MRSRTGRRICGPLFPPSVSLVIWDDLSGCRQIVDDGDQAIAAHLGNADRISSLDPALHPECAHLDLLRPPERPPVAVDAPDPQGPDLHPAPIDQLLPFLDVQHDAPIGAQGCRMAKALRAGFHRTAHRV